MNIRKAVDVERWGQLETWEASDAAYILGGVEPERGPGATLSNKATEVMEAIKSAFLVRELVPVHIAPNGAHYFLAAEVVQWATRKRFEVPAGLASAVNAATLEYLARHKAAKASASIEQEKAISIWQSKDLWSEADLSLLMCGEVPGRQTSLTNAAITAARRAISLAVAAEALVVSHWEQVPGYLASFSAPETVRYFRPADAIAWANRRRAEFPQFPMFVQVGPDSSANADDCEPPTAQALCEKLPVVPLKHASAMSKPANKIEPIKAPSRETSEDEIKRVYAEHGRRMNEARQAKAALNSGDSIESAVVECLQLNGAKYKNQEAFITDMLDKYTEVRAEKTIRRWLAKLPPNAFPPTWKKRPKT